LKIGSSYEAIAANFELVETVWKSDIKFPGSPIMSWTKAEELLGRVPLTEVVLFRSNDSTGKLRLSSSSTDSSVIGCNSDRSLASGIYMEGRKLNSYLYHHVNKYKLPYSNLVLE
jgi:hypothetical protein